MARIGDILLKTRKQYFTGREKEIAEFRQLLGKKKLTVNVLFLYGPAGQGKTTIVKEYIELCRENGCGSLYLDGRDITPSAAGFYEALFKPLEVSSVQEALLKFENSSKTFVLFIDTYEKLSALDNWMQQEFVPQLPENVLTVFSGKNPPSAAWTADPGWQKLMKTIQVKNLSPDESSDYLSKRSVPVEQHENILAFTHGHPLALSLVADLFLQKPDRNFSPDDSPDIVQTLLDNFVMKSPSPAHKTALEICALTSITTQSLLASVMELEDASELFEWLKNLSFIESSPLGLYPHDLARESLVADLKWRNPDWFSHLYQKIGNYYIGKLKTASGEEQRKLLFKLNYLQRNHPMVRPFYHWEESNEFWVDLMKLGDEKALCKMVEEFYGNDAVKKFRFWLAHPAAQVWVWRSPANPQSGFVMRINTNEIDPAEKVKDDVMKKVLDCAAKEFHLRRGEVCTVFRFWMAADTHQNISRIQSSIFLFITQYYLTTQNLAIHLLCAAKPEFWKALLNYYGMEHVPSLDYTANNVPRGFFVHDWRKIPPEIWISSLAGKYTTSRDQIKTVSKQEIVVLNESEFSGSVYAALKDYHSEKRLEVNPLLRSKCITGMIDGNISNSYLIDALKERIDDAITKIEQSPRDERFHRILYRTFINPVGSQEQTAEFLSLPFSTYRRHLKKAVELVSDILWRQETSS